MNNPGQFESADSEMQGWYREDGGTAPQRVRLSIERRSLCMHSLTAKELARWSLDHLENRAIPSFGRDWVIGDSRVPGAILTPENDGDYLVIRRQAQSLQPLSARTWRQVFLAGLESENLTGWPVLLLMMAGFLSFALWWFLFA